MASKSGRTINFSEEEKILLAKLGKNFQLWKIKDTTEKL